MKKSKLLLVITLGLVLAMLTFTTNTFSWFNRPTTDKGDALELSLSSMPISTGKVSMETHLLEDNGEPTAENVANFSNNSGIANGKRVSYRTTLTNNSDTDQSVSLYISKLSDISGGNFYLGVNDPLKTYKQYKITKAQTYKSELKDFESNGLKNIYIGFQKDDNYTPTNWEISDDDIKNYVGDISDGDGYGHAYNIYAVTVDSTITHLQLYNGSIQNSNKYLGEQNVDTTNLVRIYKNLDGTGGVYCDEISTRVPNKYAAKITQYYKNATVVKGESISIGAQGNSLSYSSEHNNIASISNSGLIKGESEGETDIKIISTGAMGEELSVTCHVTVVENVYEAFDGTDVPIITNVKVPAPGANSSGQVTIDWFIKNDGGSTMSYKIESVYLTL